ncbi:MAG: hypothetical protein WBG57_04225 [Ornithinimicrobium sp.]
MSIGIMFGHTPWNLREAPIGVNPVLTAADVTDVSAAFVADPFAIWHDDCWHLFFEVMNRKSGKGEIGHATSNDAHGWKYDAIVLSQDFHLSYPAVYVTSGGMWMVPESFESNQVRLYRADPFPTTWTLEKVLIDGVAGGDPTLWRNDDGTWSMLLCSAEGSRNETLLRYEGASLFGPWTESRHSPLVNGDAAIARPGGHCFSVEGIRYRLAQDCSRRYGERLRSLPLAEPWNQDARNVLQPQGTGWRGRGTHHADLHQMPSGYLAFVDGECWAQGG